MIDRSVWPRVEVMGHNIDLPRVEVKAVSKVMHSHLRYSRVAIIRRGKIELSKIVLRRRVEYLPMKSLCVRMSES